MNEPTNLTEALRVTGIDPRSDREITYTHEIFGTVNITRMLENMHEATPVNLGIHSNIIAVNAIQDLDPQRLAELTKYTDAELQAEMLEHPMIWIYTNTMVKDIPDENRIPGVPSAICADGNHKLREAINRGWKSAPALMFEEYAWQKYAITVEKLVNNKWVEITPRELELSMRGLYGRDINSIFGERA